MGSRTGTNCRQSVRASGAVENFRQTRVESVRQLKVLVIILASTAALAGPASSQTNCKVPGASVTLAPNQNADTGQGIVLTTFFNRPGIKGCIGATDMKGTPTWSYCSLNHVFMTRWVPGGTVLMLTNDNFTNYQVDE